MVLFSFDSSPMHSLTCRPKSFSIIAGLGEESSEIDGVSCTVEFIGTGGGSVLIERVGRILARGRLEVGGRSEGDVLRERDSPMGTLRVGGLNEGEVPFTSLVDMF